MGASKTPPETLHLGPFQLLVEHRVLLRDGEPVALAPRAVEVLVVLARHANEIISKNDLMHAVWPDTFVEEVNLAVHISALRKLLASTGCGIQIETIPKRGYRLRGEIATAGIYSPDKAATVEALRGDGAAVAMPTQKGMDTAIESQPVAAAQQDGSSGPLPAVRLPLKARTLASIVLAVATLVAAGVWLDRWVSRAGAGVEAGGARIRSLAVLPLDNLSGDPNQDYFAAGITDELTTELAHIRGLRVVSRTSASQSRTAHRSLPEIAEALHVDGVIEGSVVRAGSRVRITTQLIEAASDRHLWAGTYEDSVNEIIALQDRVARDVAREVQAAVKPEAGLLPTEAQAHPAVDRQAYDDYLQGLYVWNRRDSRTYDKAIEYFSRATVEDPHFAPAFASLADVYVLYGLNSDAGERFALFARHAALEALAQDANSAEAHAALAATSAVFEWNWTAAGAEFQRAIEIDPNYATAHQWYADFYLIPELRLDDAGKELESALALDPLSPIMIVDNGWVRYLKGDFTTAREQFDHALAIDPDFMPARFRMEGWYFAQGRDPEAAKALADNIRLSRGDEAAAGAVEEGFARNGMAGLARVLLEGRPNRRELPTGLVAASYYAVLHDAAGTCAALSRGLDQREPALLYLDVDPRYAEMRKAPCYGEVVKRMGLPERQIKLPASQ